MKKILKTIRERFARKRTAGKSRQRRQWVKKFDFYIIKNFLGTYIFAILLLMAIVIIFDINEKLDAVIDAPLKDTVLQ